MTEYISALDARILQALYDVRDPSVVSFFVFITQLGTSWFVYGLALLLTIFLALRKKYSYAAGLAISVVSSGIFVLLAKGIVERARPDTLYQVYAEIWHSFPSAHAALAVALFGFLAYLSWRMILNLPLRTAVASLFFIIIALVSFSRMYLGVHYASDVVAGLMVGALSVYLGVRWARFAHTT